MINQQLIASQRPCARTLMTEAEQMLFNDYDTKSMTPGHQPWGEADTAPRRYSRVLILIYTIDLDD